jgi:osmotically-inducible protein OsmY
VKLSRGDPWSKGVGREVIHPNERFSMHGGNMMQPLKAADPAAIAEVALERLRECPYKAMRRVSCKCENGVLFLRGRLFSFHEKQVAQEVVAGVNGVTQVVNEIQVILHVGKGRGR